MPRSLSAGLLLALAAGAHVQAATPDRFDLACDGRSVTTGQRGRFDKAVSTLASVDLAAMRFCWRDKPCSPLPIRAAAPDRLTLRDEHTPQGSLVYVVRWPSGDYVGDTRVRLTPPPDVVSHEQGRCRKRPFTAF